MNNGVTWAELTNFLLSVAAILTPISVIIVGWITNRKLTKVHDSVNGKMEKLLEVSNAASKAEGVKEEKESQLHHHELALPDVPDMRLIENEEKEK